MRCISPSSMLASGGCQDGNTQVRNSDEEDDVAANDRGVADYGIDAPGVVRNLALGGVAAFVVGVGSYHALRSSHKVLATVVRTTGFIGGVANLLLVALMLLSSKVGKFRERERVLESIPWRGDETVLDVGCGRGLMLIGAAKRLKTGKAVGIDIWQKADQSGNDPEGTRHNAEVEGVADRVEVRDGDARELPFEDGTFDVVLSSLVLHNIHEEAGREQALKEIVRVTKPGGRVAILDILHTRQYERVLRESGMEEVGRSGVGFLCFFTSRTLRAVKPLPTEDKERRVLGSSGKRMRRRRC